MSIICIIILSIISAICYRLGGIGKPYNTKVRDFGCPFIALLTIILCLHINVQWYVHLCTFLCMFGAMTTYCTPKSQPDVLWWNWLLTGLLYGVSAFPYPIVTGHWAGFWYRVVFLGVFTCIWSESNDKDWLEEGGRGFLFNISLAFLLLSS